MNLKFKEIVTTGTIASDSLNIVTVPATVMNDIDVDSQTERTVVINGAGKDPTTISPEVSFSIQANSTRLIADTAFFDPTMAGFDSGSPDLQQGWRFQVPVQIPGAGPNGSVLYATIIAYFGDAEVYLDTKAVVGVTNATGVTFGHKSAISWIKLCFLS